jgi:uncharacterized protein with NRDE domain
MCLVVIAWQLHPSQDLIVAANRDEQHARAATSLDCWPESPGVAAGRDLVAGGTWLGVDADGRFACVTNYRGEPARSSSPRSRGQLVSGFLGAGVSAADYLDHLAGKAEEYPGFSLLIADQKSLWYASNRSAGFARRLPAGVHGLSNDLLDVGWAKVDRCKLGLREALDAGDPDPETLFALLAERHIEASGTPNLPWPATSGPFIADKSYGTRASTLVMRQPGSTWISERRFGPEGRLEGRTALQVAHTTLNGA